jgi:hypothetical protein
VGQLPLGVAGARAATLNASAICDRQSLSKKSDRATLSRHHDRRYPDDSSKRHFAASDRREMSFESRCSDVGIKFKFDDATKCGCEQCDKIRNVAEDVEIVIVRFHFSSLIASTLDVRSRGSYEVGEGLIAGLRVSPLLCIAFWRGRLWPSTSSYTGK